MKIAFITLGYTPVRTSGLDISGERLVGALLEAGHEVTVIAGRRSSVTETQLHPKLSIYRAPLGRSNWIGFAYQAAQLLQQLNKAHPFDVVHFWDVHFAYAYRGKFVASVQHSFRQRLAYWNWRQASRRAWLYQPLYYLLARTLAETPSIRRASGLLAGSATTQAEFIRAYKVSPARITLVRHGIDPEFFRPGPGPAITALRQRLGLAEHEPVLLFVGFITPRKGLNYLAEALPRVQPSARLLLVGRWAEPDLARFLQALGPAAAQVLPVGYVPDEQMPLYYSLADVYVSASLLEGFGLPLAEALACETPVVATQAGAVAEVVGPGGILVPPRDSMALAEAISQLLTQPALRREMGQLGRAWVIDHFSLQTMLQNALEAYERFA